MAPIADPTIDLAEIATAGHDLARPECVLATKRGDLFVAHAGVGVTHIAPDGRQAAIGNHHDVDGQPFIPNGIALAPDGSFWVTNMGEGGGLWRLDRDGALTPLVREVDGKKLTATNFVLRDGERLWFTITTRHWPISEAFSPLGGPYLSDGYIVLFDQGGTRIVADGLAFANEVRIDAAGTSLYAVETYARRIIRFRIDADGSLTHRETFAEFGLGTFPDGMAFDAEGALWVASIISNRVIRITPDGRQHVVIEDSDPAFMEMIEQRLRERSLQRADVQKSPAKLLQNIASITFGGPDLRTAYLGSLGGDKLFTFRSPVAGVAPAHWDD
jgi:sugar lactone lactonase YvrE